MLDLKLVRQNAELKAKDNFYTWIAPDRVIAMIDEIERLRGRVAELERDLRSEQTSRGIDATKLY